jgi:hypothetical protein
VREVPGSNPGAPTILFPVIPLKRTIKLAPVIAILAIPAPWQQIASVDLTPPAPTVDKASDDTLAKENAACGKVGVGFADGWAFYPDKKPRRIHLAITDLSSKDLVVDGHIEATVEMRNTGDESVQIPWSTDWQTTVAGQDPENRSWEFGMFRVFLGQGKSNEVELVDLSQGLYASRFVTGSSLTLKSGEWVSARIKVQVKSAHPAYEQIDQETKPVLHVEWFQTGRYRRFKDCGVTLGYFPYKDAYEQESPSVAVRIDKRPTEESKTTAPR